MRDLGKTLYSEISSCKSAISLITQIKSDLKKTMDVGTWALIGMIKHAFHNYSALSSIVAEIIDDIHKKDFLESG